MNILVLAGGTSSERDVSFVTGSMVFKALKENGHNAELVDVFTGDVIDAAAAVKSTSPDIEEVKKNRKPSSDGFFGEGVLDKCKKADIVFMALHGEDGEDGKIQAAFDLLGIKYTGTGYLGSALAMNKDIAKELFIKNNVPTPQGTTVYSDDADKEVKFPCVVKPACGGSSVGVSIAHDEAEYKAALKEAFAWENKLVVEEYIKGREFSVGVIDGKALPIIEIAPIAGFYDYKNKYQAGSTVETCPAVLTKEQTEKMQDYAQKAYEALKLSTYARMDFIMAEDGRMFCLEANTLPGMTPTSLLPQEAAAENVNFNELCELLIKVSLRKYE